MHSCKGSQTSRKKIIEKGACKLVKILTVPKKWMKWHETHLKHDWKSYSKLLTDFTQLNFSYLPAQRANVHSLIYNMRCDWHSEKSG